MPDTIMSRDFATNPSPQPLLRGAQMRDLWAAYEAARDSYRESEPRTGAAFAAAQDRILAARTLDPEGNALKLRVIAERADCSPALLGSIVEDLMRPRPAPSLAEFCRAISEAAAPHTEEGGGIKSKIGLADALIPLIGHYTIADATCAIAMLHSAYTVLGGEDGDDPMFAAMMLLEEFGSFADAADADSASARAHLIEQSECGEGWDLGPENMAEATRRAAADMRTLRLGTAFRTNAFGATFETYFSNRFWREKADAPLPVAAE